MLVCAASTTSTATSWPATPRATKRTPRRVPVHENDARWHGRHSAIAAAWAGQKPAACSTGGMGGSMQQQARPRRHRRTWRVGHGDPVAGSLHALHAQVHGGVSLALRLALVHHLRQGACMHAAALRGHARTHACTWAHRTHACGGMHSSDPACCDALQCRQRRPHHCTPCATARGSSLRPRRPGGVPAHSWFTTRPGAGRAAALLRVLPRGAPGTAPRPCTPLPPT